MKDQLAVSSEWVHPEGERARGEWAIWLVAVHWRILMGEKEQVSPL